MGGTFSQIHIQVVFAVRFRARLIQKSWKDDLCSYIAGIINAKNQKCLIVNCVEDHVHILIGVRPSITVSDLVRDIKNNTSNYINEKQFVKGHFAWQEGYSVFSYSKSDLPKVYAYISNQEEHHKKTTFKDEYVNMLKETDIEFDEKYLFDWK